MPHEPVIPVTNYYVGNVQKAVIHVDVMCVLSQNQSINVPLQRVFLDTENGPVMHVYRNISMINMILILILVDSVLQKKM